MVDYILNVAVAISAGVAAVTSALPNLQSQRLTLCLCLLALITIVNLRGTIVAGRVFGVPTYIFLFSFLAVIGIGIAKGLTDATVPVMKPPDPAPATEMLGLWLFL